MRKADGEVYPKTRSPNCHLIKKRVCFKFLEFALNAIYLAFEKKLGLGKMHYPKGLRVIKNVYNNE